MRPAIWGALTRNVADTCRLQRMDATKRRSKTATVTDDELSCVVEVAISALEQMMDRDWTLAAGSLEWTCWQTIDHTIDCVHSFALQIGAEAQAGFLPFIPMHAEVTATPSDLIQGLRGVSALLIAITRESPQDRTASDGFVSLNIADWRARTAYEVALHTYDVVTGLSGSFSVSDELASSIIGSEMLWMLDRSQMLSATVGWEGLVRCSGRQTSDSRVHASHAESDRYSPTTSEVPR